MRPVDQVSNDLQKALVAEDAAKAAVIKLKVELEEIHTAVREALGLRT